MTTSQFLLLFVVPYLIGTVSVVALFIGIQIWRDKRRD